MTCPPPPQPEGSFGTEQVALHRRSPKTPPNPDRSSVPRRSPKTPNRKRPPAPLPSVPEGTLLEPADARRLRQGPVEVRRPRRVPPSLKVRFEFRHTARRRCIGSRWCSEPRRHRSWHSPRPGPKSVSESSTSARCSSRPESIDSTERAVEMAPRASSPSGV
jgi:hypothetical protein